MVSILKDLLGVAIRCYSSGYVPSPVATRLIGLTANGKLMIITF